MVMPLGCVDVCMEKRKDCSFDNAFVEKAKQRFRFLDEKEQLNLFVARYLW
jgi:hypothetical protein